MEIKQVILKGMNFLTRQEGPYKANMLRRSFENFAILLVQQYQSIYIIALGATSVQVGLVNSLAGVGTAITALPAGWAIDRYGLKKTFYFGTIMMALGALLYGLATNWLITIPAMLFLTLAYRINMTSCPVVCGSCLVNTDRAMGMQICDSLASISGMIAPLIGTVILTKFGGLTVVGIKYLFYLQFAVILLAFIILMKKFKNPRKRSTAAINSGIRSGIHDVMKNGIMVKRFLLYQSLTYVPFILSAIYVPLFAVLVKKADPFALGGMTTASMLIPLMLSIPIGRLADKIGRKRVIYMSLPVYCLSLLLLTFAPESDSTTLIASGVLQGFLMVAMITGNAIRSELVPIHLLGSWSGLIGLFAGVVGIIAPISAGFLWNTVNPSSVLFMLMLSQILALSVLLTVPETLKLKRNQSNP